MDSLSFLQSFDAVAWVRAGGLLAIALILAAERFVPFIPSYVTLAILGAMGANGAFSLGGGIAASVAGSYLGCGLWYWLGSRISEARVRGWIAQYGRYMMLTPKGYDKARGTLLRDGGPAMLILQIIPTIRVFATFPAGVLRIPFAKLTPWTLAGITLWNGSFLVLGYVSGDMVTGDIDLEAALTVLAADLVLIGAILLAHKRFKQKYQKG